MLAPAWVALAFAVGAETGAGQLISPGKLAASHAELEGIRNCTKCHALGAAGVSADRCMDCHQPIRSRIESGTGVHGALEDSECAQCHKDHFGEGFDLLRFDTDRFEHEAVGYDLRGRHRDADCRECHRAALIDSPDVLDAREDAGWLARTYLGLSRDCARCHQTDDPHLQDPAEDGCDGCHGEEGWETLSPFDHSGARFPLDGRHQGVECIECHEGVPRTGAPGGEAVVSSESAPRQIPFRGIPFGTCSSCHQDPHRGSMRGACASCHTTGGWSEIGGGIEDGGFDHARTAFPLVGLHVELTCDACHRNPPPQTESISIRFRPGPTNRTYPRPVVRGCRSCHLDPHEGQLVDLSTDGECGTCHGEGGWRPTTFGLERHDGVTTFPLTGAHRVTPCAECHVPGDPSTGFVFEFPDQSCRACHDGDDPHQGIFENAPCTACHDTEAFSPAEFDHNGWPSASQGDCGACHATDDPHGSQFSGRSCGECHGTTGFLIDGFDHSTTTFALDGAHEGLGCAACHRPDPLDSTFDGIRYRPLGYRCRDCHGGGRG